MNRGPIAIRAARGTASALVVAGHFGQCGRFVGVGGAVEIEFEGRADELRALALTNPGAGTGPTITAGIGRGTSIGTLSVLRGWVTTPRPSIVSVEFNAAGWDAMPVRSRNRQSAVPDSECGRAPSAPG